jgi:GrpB-like predicted nucleotidyltransferase (UPF0157 family)
VVSIVDYDPAWPATFAWLRDRASRVLGDIAQSIEHVGSTSVPGLAAKPIIDIDIVVPTPEASRASIARLSTLGYEHLGDLGMADREAFRAPPEDPAHHLYVCLAGSRALRNHVQFRDYLRAHPDAVAAYATLKRNLATAFAHDRLAYAEAKTAFIVRILQAQGSLSSADLAAISAENVRASP